MKAVAKCNLCKMKIPARDYDMAYHLITMHPFEMITSEKFVDRVSGFFFKLGGGLADKLKGRRA